jgi:hypothetical protein
MSEAKGHTLVNLAELALRTGDTSEAAMWIEAARAFVLNPEVMNSWRMRLRWELAVGRLAFIEGRRSEALDASERVLGLAATAIAPKHEILAHVQRAEILGRAGGGLSSARAAFELARGLNSRPLIARASRTLSGLLPDDEGRYFGTIFKDATESLAAALPDSFQATYLASWERTA